MARTKKLPKGLWKRGNIYYARFRHGGRMVQKRLSSDLDVAKVALNDLRARADKGDLGIIDNDCPWTDLKERFLRWAKQAVRNPGDYKRDLERFEAYCRVQSVRQIDQDYVVGYREWRLSQNKGAVAGKEWQRAAGKRVSPRTVNREVGTLQNMLNKGVDWKMIGLNPLAALKPLRHDEPTKDRRSLSAAEVELIFANAPDWLRKPLRLFASTGIRRNELVSLRITDVDFERRCIVIRASVAKSRKAREIPLDDDTAAMLAKLCDQAKQRERIPGKTPEGRFSREHVFVTAWNTPLRNNLLRAFYAVCKRAGIEGGWQGGSVDLHSLRGTFTTLTIENGANPKAVQSILGHSTLAMTMGVYAKATERSKRDAIAALPFARVTPPDHVIAFPKSPDSATGTNSEAEAVTAKALAVAT